MSEFKEFQQAEIEGWGNPDRAAGYVALFAQAADQAIEPLLKAAGVTKGKKVLDLCCGQGNVAKALAARGCETVGADFSPAMIAIARERVPQARFEEGDAQDLQFDDGEFDAVVSNFGICHVPDQPRAFCEARRVLKPGGRFALSVWCGPDVSPSFQAIYEAVKAHGHPDVSAPPGPDFHQFANPDIAQGLFAEAGFADITHEQADCAWEVGEPEGLFRIFAEGTVRAAMLLSSQPPENLAAIKAAITAVVQENFVAGDGWRCPAPAAVISGRA
jgi:SAM-dependent methyltransferase